MEGQQEMAGQAVRFPVSLDLRGLLVLVVGAGTVGARRAERALAAGAQVVLVSPTLAPSLEAHIAAGRVDWREQTWAQFESQEPGLAGADLPWLVLAATDDADVNAEIAQWCRDRHLWCNRADDRMHSPAWIPALASWDDGDVQVAVTSTHGPRHAISIRDELLDSRSDQ